MIPFSEWGKDHWSLLAYIETCCENLSRQTGELDKRRLRCNHNTHPLLNVNNLGWSESYGTRLKDFWSDDKEGTGVLPEHDDWDCLDDLEAEGLVDVISEVNGFVRILPNGIKLAERIRAWKIQGGTFSNFHLVAGDVVLSKEG